LKDASRNAELPIGIFDSGVGGLTVLSALRARLAGEHYIYLGDTARLPYGTKSPDTVIRYSAQASRRLVEQGVKLLVVACNTASAAALPDLRRLYSPLPVIGVVEPGAQAVCRLLAPKQGERHILVMGTESTIRGGAYTRAIRALRPDARITGLACSLLVPLAEEGWMDGPIVENVIRRYLEQLDGEAGRPLDCIVLGCTHFPPLAASIAAVAGPGIPMIDSAVTTAEAVEAELRKSGLLRPKNKEETGRPLRFLTTDAPERFARTGGLFLDIRLAPEEVELVVI
jgi:glutamate racemase